MKTAFVTLIAGLALGSGVSSLFWSSRLTQSYAAISEWKKASDQWQTVSNKFETQANVAIDTARACLLKFATELNNGSRRSNR